MCSTLHTIEWGTFFSTYQCTTTRNLDICSTYCSTTGNLSNSDYRMYHISKESGNASVHSSIHLEKSVKCPVLLYCDKELHCKVAK